MKKYALPAVNIDVNYFREPIELTNDSIGVSIFFLIEYLHDVFFRSKLNLVLSCLSQSHLFLPFVSKTNSNTYLFPNNTVGLPASIIRVPFFQKKKLGFFFSILFSMSQSVFISGSRLFLNICDYKAV